MASGFEWSRTSRAPARGPTASLAVRLRHPFLETSPGTEPEQRSVHCRVLNVRLFWRVRRTEAHLFPLRDENPTSLTPLVTWLLVGVNVAVWILVEGAGTSEDVLANAVCAFGAIPAEITGAAEGFRAVELAPGLPPCMLGGLTIEALFTSMFMHGSWLHLISNMWFLWIFGNNIEDSMGHVRFLLFYLIAGLIAAGAHIITAPNSPIPMVGASGAISGVMGAYLLLYPRIRIQTLFIFIIFIRVIPIPAWIVLVWWFVLQILSGVSVPVGGGGVAFWAHIGGFVAGLVLVKLFENRQLVAARRHHVQLSPFEVPHRGWW
ncbi:MAG: rhomboid family intramembrane serine protease [Gemmatimonadetes bacterium]|nr:rhomboid family intramembrane serine protease [Gemmatimonadota bacterium]